jgi:hypothetical protein
MYALSADTGGNWWDQQSTTTKGMLVGGGAILLGAMVWAFTRKSGYASNARKSKHPKAKRGSIQYKMRKAGRKCPAKPPARYARKGARQRSQYAFPECYGWPIHNRVHVIAAKAKFTRFGGRLPPTIRAQVRKRISAASKKLGLGAY